MEHIVQFGVNIDDNFIKKNIEKKAEQEIIQSLTKDATKIFFDVNRWGEVSNIPSPFAKQVIKEFLEENKETIFEMTSKFLSDKLARTKRGKEILEEITEKG